MSLKSLDQRKKSIIKKIEYYQNVLEEKVLPEYQKEISKAEKECIIKKSEISYLQQNLLLNSASYSFEQLVLSKNELNNLCDELLVLEKNLKEKRVDYNSKKTELNLSSFDETKNLLLKENENLKNINQLISDEREKERLRIIAENNANNDSSSTNNPDIDNKVWIDENLGIYIIIDKKAVITAVVNDFYNHKIPEDKIEYYCNPELSGLAALIDMFIDILIKAIGNMSKQFFFFKNTIDLLVGFQLGELLGNAIPGVVKVLQELKLLFSDPAKWMLQQMLAPLFDSNIPIPKFCLDIGEFIPLLPFKLCIPEIDPFGYFSKLTPLNLNNDEPVPLNWIEEIKKDIKSSLKNDLEESQKIEKNKLDKLDNEINIINNRLNNINIYESPLKNCQKKLENLKLKENACHEFGCTQDIIDTLCDELEENQKCLLDLTNKYNIEEEKINNIDRILEKEKLNDLKEKKNLLNQKDFKTQIEYKKRAILIAFSQNIEKDDLDVKLSRMHEIGVNVFDNTNLELLQKIGHDFSNDNYLSRLENIRKLGVSLSNNKLLRFLYEIGFNFNDSNHYTKLSKLKNYISLDSTNIILLFEMGLNINNPSIFDILKKLKEYDLDITDLTIITRLQNISFNFNNPNVLDRLEYLLKYVDLNDPTAYNTALKRNINLNNPYLNMILEKTYKISLRWGGINENGYFDVENEIFNDTSIPDNVDYINSILETFKYQNNYLYQIFLIHDSYDTNIRSLSEQINGDTLYKEYTNVPVVYYWNKNIYYGNYIYYYPDYKKKYTTYTIKCEHDFSLDRIEIRTNKVINGNINKKYEKTTLLKSITTEDVSGGLNFNSETEIKIPYGQSFEVFWNKKDNSSDTKTIEVLKEGTSLFSASLENYPSGITSLYIENDASIIGNIISNKVKCITLSHYYDFLNQYKKYDITINSDKLMGVPLFDDIYPYTGEYIYGGGRNNTKYRVIKNIDEYIEKINLLKEFHINKGWKVDSNGDGIIDDNDITVNENIGGRESDPNWNNVNNDFENIIDGLTNSDGDALSLVKEPTPDKTKITYAVLLGIYGNFDKLGLNIKDPKFKEKFNLLYNKFDLNIDETVILDTTRTVTLNYTDINTWEWKNNHPYHPSKTVNLNNSKADPRVYRDKRYEATINVVETLNPNVDIQPTKAVVQFDVLRNLGFNFQQEKYGEFVTRFGPQLDLTKFETKLISDSLISLGWHWSNDPQFEILNRFVNFGFSFKLIKDSTTNPKYPSQMFSKLEHLSNWGFNFYKTSYINMLNKLIELDIKLNYSNFDTVVENLIGFGISLNDSDWKEKLQALINLNMSFNPTKYTNIETYINNNLEIIRVEQWKLELDNLHSLGIDFYGDDWKKKYNKALSIKRLGLDFKRTELREKLNILTKLGIDFSEPENDWMQKIEGLVKLKLLTIPDLVKDKKKKYLEKRQEKINNIENEIRKYTILSENPFFFIDENIIKTYNQLNIYKEELKNGGDKEKLCDLILDLDKKLKKEQTEKENLKIINIDYSNKIEKLTKDRNNIKNDVYKLNENLVFGDLKKFIGLKNSGLNFYDDKYKKNIDNLVKNGFDFSKPNWEELLSDLKEFIDINPILEWQLKMIEMIKTVIMMPLQMIMGIIKKLMDLIKQVIGIPLNPIKIPDWSKGIIDKFYGLIEMFMKLPTLEGMIDFLFMNVEGLTLVDMIIPGFSLFMTTLKEKIKLWKDEENNLNNKIDLDILNLQKMKVERNNLINEIYLATNKNDAIKKIDFQKKIIEDNNLKLKELTTKSDLSLNTLKYIETELKKNCDAIDNLDDLIDDYNSENNNSNGNSNTSNDIDLNNQLKIINEDINKLSDSISKDKRKRSELKEKNNSLSGKFCDWRKDFDTLIIKILRGLIDDIKNEKNPYDDKLIDAKRQFEKYQKSLIQAKAKKDELNNSVGTNDDGTNSTLKIRLISEIDNINTIICNNTNSNSTINNALEKKKELEIQLANLNNQKFLLDDINNIIKKLSEKINKLKNSIDNLETKNKEFKDKQLKNLIDLDGVAKWIPTILNIICSAPKMIVNIFIGIVNSIGHMDYLPTLWEFDYI